MIKDMIKDNTVTFAYYRGGELWYSLPYQGSDFLFPVPVSDVGDATMLAQDKAILFMRYIRKHLKELETAG